MRHSELDSMRGLAATSVLLAHISIILPNMHFFEIFKNTPLHIFWLGHESVILFFILSGFVLSLPYISNRQLSYGNYLVRRICRICLPSICSVMIASGVMSIYSGRIESLSEFFNGIWVESPTFYSLLNNIFLLGELDRMSVNPVLWSLVHEMRISIVFPFIMFILLRKSNKFNIIFMCSIPLLYFLSLLIGLKFFKFDYTSYLSGYSSFILTPYYTGFFILGSLIAINKDLICKKIMLLSTSVKILLTLIGVISYLYVWIIIPNFKTIHNFIINDWIVAFGGTVFIIATLNSKRISFVLKLKPIHAMGKISYSLYLYHMIVMLTLIYMLHDKINMAMILILSFVGSFFVAYLMYYIVEIPAIKLGKKLTSLSSKEIKRSRVLSKRQPAN